MKWRQWGIFVAAATSCFSDGVRSMAQVVVSQPVQGLFRNSYTGVRQISVPKFDPSLGTLTSAKLTYTVQYSGTISGTATGPANTSNGWSTEFSGTIRLTGSGFNTMDFGLYNTRSGLVFQPNTPIFQAFGPSDIGGSVTFNQGLSAYTGSGTVPVNLAWPIFTADLFYSQGGTKNTPRRDLGAVGGEIAYTYVPIPEPHSLPFVGIATALIAIVRLRFKN